MTIDITIPSPGESISEVVLGPWHKTSGTWVDKDDTLVEIESDKVTLEVPAPESGVLEIVAEEGAEMAVGDVIGRLDPSGSPESGGAAKGEAERSEGGDDAKNGAATATATEVKPSTPERTPATSGSSAGDDDAPANGGSAENGQRATSMARKIAADQGIDLAKLRGSGPSGRIRKSDVLAATDRADQRGPSKVDVSMPAGLAGSNGGRGVRREKMTKLRRRIAERLVEAQHSAAMLTTFNEADMSAVMALRKTYKEAFKERHGVGLGFMGFFVKAAVSALQAFPRINAYIVGDEIEYHDFVDISIAVGTDRGLVVPVLRNTEQMTFAEIEMAIKDFAQRAGAGKLTIEDMTGGTFTLSNGGVYGSVNSTPILNPPQSAILGMHRIMSRPVEDPENPGQIALRPMMNLAVSYDHRIVDGAEAVSFLVHIRDCIERPERMMLDV